MLECYLRVAIFIESVVCDHVEEFEPPGNVVPLGVRLEQLNGDVDFNLSLGIEVHSPG